MISYGEAMRILRESARAFPILETEELDLDQAIGRITAAAITSQEQIPPYANSAMDGFAVRAEWTKGASPDHPRRFPVVGSVVAGDAPPASAPREGVWEIMTGAPFPVGFDASIRIEDVTVTRDERGAPLSIEIHDEAVPGQNYRDAGEDFDVGTVALPAGRRIRPEDALALASLGAARVSVRRRPRIALISTGRELVEPGEKPGAGQIRNSTGVFLKAAVRDAGYEFSYYGIVADEPKDFARVMATVLTSRPDVIITTGAVSMGKHDFVGTSLEELGAEISFHKAAIRPGKPILFGRFPKGPAVFGLPGNPVSTVVGFRFFVTPYLREAQALPPEKPLRAQVKAPNGKSVGKPDGLRCFYKARLHRGDSEPRIEILPGQLSFMVSPLLRADAWAVLDEKGDEAAEGQWIDVFPLSASAGEGEMSDETIRTPRGGDCAC